MADKETLKILLSNTKKKQDAQIVLSARTSMLSRRIYRVF